MKKKLQLNKQIIANLRASDAQKVLAGKNKMVDTQMPSFDACKSKTCKSCDCGSLICESVFCRTKWFCTWGLTCGTNCITDCDCATDVGC